MCSEVFRDLPVVQLEIEVSLSGSLFSCALQYGKDLTPSGCTRIGHSGYFISVWAPVLTRVNEKMAFRRIFSLVTAKTGGRVMGCSGLKNSLRGELVAGPVVENIES